MPTYYKPGTRRGNTTYTVRGTINRQRHELRCEAAKTKAAAEAEWDAYKREVGTSRALRSATAGEIIDAYKAARNPSPNDRRYLERLRKAWIAHRKCMFQAIPIAEVVTMDIAVAADVLYPGCKESTKNRQAYVPAAAVIHFAANNQLCAWQRVSKLSEAEPETRRPRKGTAEALIGVTEGRQKEFVTFLFLQGWRVSEAIKQRWENTDLQSRTFRVFVSKAGRWKTIHMHPEVFLALAQRPEEEGPLWPWKDRWAVYRWLRPLTKKLKVKFTPHMARHEWGSQQNEAGGTLKDAVDGSTWTDIKSVTRYQTPSAEHGVKIASRVKIGGNVGQKRAK